MCREATTLQDRREKMDKLDAECTKAGRSLFIGLGGLGVLALSYIKAEIQRQLSGVPNIIQFRGIDIERCREELGSSSKSNPLSAAEFVQLEAPDLMRETSIKKVLEIVEKPEVARWFPHSIVREIEHRSNMAGSRGGQLGAYLTARALGRLALFANADKVYRMLSEACAEICNAQAEAQPHETTRETAENTISDDLSVNIYIICSLAGGTGSGIFFDIAAFCRGICSKSRARVIGILLLPGIFKSFVPWVKWTEANTYAALKELEHIMERAEEEIVEYSSGFSVKWTGDQKSLFDLLFLLDNCNAAMLMTVDVARWLYLVAKGVAMLEFASSRSEPAFPCWTIPAVASHLVEEGDEVKFIRPHHTGYMSFGIAEDDISILDPQAAPEVFAEELNQTVRTLLYDAAPLLRFHTLPEYKIIESVVVGAGDAVIKETVQSILEDVENYYDFTWPSQPQHLSLLRLTGPVPPRWIIPMANWKESYLEIEGRSRLTLHIHKDWVGVNGLPDLLLE